MTLKDGGVPAYDGIHLSLLSEYLANVTAVMNLTGPFIPLATTRTKRSLSGNLQSILYYAWPDPQGHFSTSYLLAQANGLSSFILHHTTIHPQLTV